MMSQSCHFYPLSTCRSYVRVILYLPTHLNITVEIVDNILPSEPREGAKLTAWWHLLKGILNTIMFRCHICHNALTITILLVLLHITCIINPYRILAVHNISLHNRVLLCHFPSYHLDHSLYSHVSTKHSLRDRWYTSNANPQKKSSFFFKCMEIVLIAYIILKREYNVMTTNLLNRKRTL